VFTPADRDAVEPRAPSNTTHGPAHLMPTYVPPYPFLSTPAPIPRPRDVPNASQRGHVTALNHVQDARERSRADYNAGDHACAGYRTEYQANSGVHKPHTPRYDDGQSLELAELEDMYAKWGHEPPAALFNELGGTSNPTYAHTPATPSPPSLPIPIPSPCSPHTRLPFDATESRDHDEPAPPAPSLSDAQRGVAPYLNLKDLRRDYHDGIQGAIDFMTDLQNYSDYSMYEHEEWKADEREKIRKNHNITYPKRDTQATPRSWYADGSEYSTPDVIEQSRPIGPGLKRRRYRNFRTPRYRVTQPRLPLVPRPPPELDDDTTSGIPPSPTTRSNKHHTNNRTPKPPRNVNFDTTPYLTSQSRPPPWPNKNSNKNRNKYYYGTHTPAGTTARRRPPPWPIIPTPTTIYSITNSRPPPWPNICHCRHKQHSPVSFTPHARPPPWPIIPHYIHSTSQNRRNAKRRVKAKSRIISDEVSV
jgi:hypothetical protein